MNLSNKLKQGIITVLITLALQAPAYAGISSWASRMSAVYQSAAARATQMATASKPIWQSCLSKASWFNATMFNRSTALNRSRFTPGGNRSNLHATGTAFFVPTLVGAGVAAAAIGKASTQSVQADAKQAQQAEWFAQLSIEIIKQNPQHKRGFLEEAKIVLCKVNGFAIERLLQVYPEAAVELTPVALKNFAQVDATVLMAILHKNPAAAQEFARMALYTDNSHLKNIFDDRYTHLWWYCEPSDWWRMLLYRTTTGSGNLARLVIDMAARDGKKISDEAFDVIENYLGRHPKLFHERPELRYQELALRCNNDRR